MDSIEQGVIEKVGRKSEITVKEYRAVRQYKGRGRRKKVNCIDQKK